MSATVQMRLFGTLRDLPPASREVLPVAPNTTIEDLLGQLGIPPGTVHLIVLNGEQVDRGALVCDGDTIEVFPPLGGGH